MALCRASSSPFGLVDFLSWDHDWNGRHYSPSLLNQAFLLMQKAKARWIRLEILLWDWDRLGEKKAFDKYDHLIRLAVEHEISVLGLVVNYPTGSDLPWNQVPETAAFLRGLKTLARRYRDVIQHWEIWNEPDHELFWTPQDNMAGYCALLRRSYDAIKKEDPSAVVHLAGLSKSLPASLRLIYENEASGSFDVVHLHPFANPLNLNSLLGMKSLVEASRRVMQNHDDQRKEIWISEIGCPGMRQPDRHPHWWLGKNPSEEAQAEWVRTVFESGLNWPGVRKIFWGQFRDTQRFFNSGVDYFGLVRNDLSQKPSFQAYRQAAENYEKKSLLLSC